MKKKKKKIVIFGIMEKGKKKIYISNSDLYQGKVEEVKEILKGKYNGELLFIFSDPKAFWYNATFIKEG